ncbi:RDD family protein [Mycobacterium frederiksbergense]|uniref:RDD family protein n=1 Tax=Mycolicibacterium frederiksbergense TaxID=117567 RepID=UPI0021F3B0A8|nr:RDD family protein [Mycolicibacterium frederiksbergense]MCV7043524.1 RDD family protein [Mycolicibacterium frederiksbergense]
MTEQPPPPPGNYPPPRSGNFPPSPSRGFPPLPPPAGGLPKEAYTPWLTRVLAWIIDIIPVAILLAIGYGLLLGTWVKDCAVEVSEYDIGAFCSAGASTAGQATFAVCVILTIAYLLWNYGYRQGNTGASVGKGILKFKVVSESTGQPIGFGMSIVRQLAHMVDVIICYIGFLFPLWDAKRQTLADKIIKTVCLPLA